MRVITLILTLAAFNSCTLRQEVKIIPLEFATKSGFMYGGDSNKVHYKNLYYLLDYKFATKKFLKDTVMKYLETHIPKDLSLYHQYEVSFIKKSSDFNEKTIKHDPSILDFQIEDLEYNVIWFKAGIPGLDIYSDGRLISSEDLKFK